MDSPLVVVAVLSVVFLAAFARSALGFGDALIAMPLLALMVGMQTATPLVALASSAIAATILMGAWRRVELKVVWRWGIQYERPARCYLWCTAGLVA